MGTRFNPLTCQLVRTPVRGVPDGWPDVAHLRGGGSTDPLAGQNLALRLQTHSGFGATPNAPTGLYKSFIAQVSQFDWTGTNGAALVQVGGGRYCTFARSSDIVAAWFNVDGANTQPDASGQGATAYIEIDVSAVDSDAQIAAAFSLTVGNSTVSGTVVTFTNPSGGPCADAVTASISSPPFEITVIQVGTYKGAPATADGDPVAAWADVLGTSGLIATQNDPTKQPMLKLVNATWVVRFDGVDDFLAVLSVAFSEIAPANNTAIFTAQTADFAYGLIGSGATHVIRGYLGLSGTLYFDCGNISRVSVAVPSGWGSGYHVVSSVRDANISSLEVDGAVLTSQGVSGSLTNEVATFYIGMDGSGICLAGDLVALLIYAGSISPANSSTIQTYIGGLNPV